MRFQENIFLIQDIFLKTLTDNPAFQTDFCDSGLERYSPTKKVMNTEDINNQTMKPNNPNLLRGDSNITNLTSQLVQQQLTIEACLNFLSQYFIQYQGSH